METGGLIMEVSVWFQVFGLGAVFGFGGSLFAGLISWGISAFCRLLLKPVERRK
jgi:hypothetical protein